MESSDADREQHQLEQFLIDGDPRQVWTLSRTDRVPVYLEDGRKEDYSADNLKCIVRGCDGPVVLVQGSVRTHYRHISHQSRHAKHVSELHATARALQSLAILEGFIETEATSHATGEAVSIKKQGSVLATHLVLSQDYRAAQFQEVIGEVGPTTGSRQWFLWAGLVSRVDGSSNTIKMPVVARELLKRGETVLIVNPTSQTIGTLVSAGDQNRAPTGNTANCVIKLNAFNECTVDQSGRVVTPEIADRRHRQHLDERRQRKSGDRGKRGVARPQVEVRRTSPPRFVDASQFEIGKTEAPGELSEVANWDAGREWAKSHARAAAHERFLGRLPSWLSEGTVEEEKLKVLPVHWHSVLYFQVLENSRRSRSVVTLVNRLGSHRWPENFMREIREQELVQKYLRVLVRAQVATEDSHGRYKIGRDATF